MRKWLMLAVLVGLLAAPVFAQLRPGMGMGGPAMLLANKGVQEELKLTDKQKEKAQEIVKEQMEAVAKAFKDKDKDAFEQARKNAVAAVQKFKEELKPEQRKRLDQIEIQTSGVMAFARGDVQKALKLTDKQQQGLREVAEETTREVRETQKDLFTSKDKEKREEAMKKLASIRKESTDKAVKLLDADQKKAWKELTGAPFELKLEGFRPGGKD